MGLWIDKHRTSQFIWCALKTRAVRVSLTPQPSVVGIKTVNVADKKSYDCESHTVTGTTEEQNGM